MSEDIFVSPHDKNGKGGGGKVRIKGDGERMRLRKEDDRVLEQLC